MTSFDWNIDEPNILGTSSIDTTCTIWDLEHAAVKTQLIAHEKEVFDISFSSNSSTFATAGADGSIRYFDIRSLEHSTILFENNNQTPFVRVTWNRVDGNYLAAVMMNSNKVLILDKRLPQTPLLNLAGHNDFVNSVVWAPTSK